VKPFTAKELVKHADSFRQYFSEYRVRWPESRRSVRDVFETFCNLDITNCDSSRTRQLWDYLCNSGQYDQNIGEPTIVCGKVSR
jgi:hypothetical protein